MLKRISLALLCSLAVTFNASATENEIQVITNENIQTAVDTANSISDNELIERLYDFNDHILYMRATEETEDNPLEIVRSLIWFKLFNDIPKIEKYCLDRKSEAVAQA